MITHSDIEEGLLAIIENRKVKADEVPDGWKTVKELAKICKRSYSQTAKLLRAASKDGSIPASKKFRVKTNNGVQPVPHYFVVKK